jgi:hypothetical protein
MCGSRVHKWQLVIVDTYKIALMAPASNYHYQVNLLFQPEVYWQRFE